MFHSLYSYSEEIEIKHITCLTIFSIDLFCCAMIIMMLMMMIIIIIIIYNHNDYMSIWCSSLGNNHLRERERERRTMNNQKMNKQINDLIDL